MLVRRPLLLFPFNGNAVEALDCVDERYRVVAFIDDAADKQGREFAGVPVLSRNALHEWPAAHVLAVPGGPDSFLARKHAIASLGIPAARFATLIHPAARISPLAKLGRNTLIMAGVVVTSNAILGDHVCVLPNSVIHHDASIGAWTLIGANVTIAGGVSIAENCYIASGTSVKHGLCIGAGALVGLGSNVIRNVSAESVVAGNPVRHLR